MRKGHQRKRLSESWGFFFYPGVFVLSISCYDDFYESILMSSLPKHLLRVLGVNADASITPLPGNENENYLVKQGADAFVVKRLRGQSAANTETEAVYRQYLAESALPVVPYVHLADDSYVLQTDNGNFVATPYQYGKTPQSDPKVIEEAARLLAKVHLLDSSSLPHRTSWYRKDYVAESLDHIDDTYAFAKSVFVEQSASAPDFWNGQLPIGIIHGDLHEDNIVVDAAGDIVGILDWEECGVEPLLLDVAHSAQQFSFERGVCNEALFHTFMRAYQEVRPLTTLEKQLFDDALRYGMLALSVWAHIKMSRGEMSEDLFQRVGNYYRSSYEIPVV